MSSHTGDIPFTIGMHAGRLKFDFGAMAEVDDLFPETAQPSPFQMKVGDLVKVAAIGFKRLSPDITEAVINAAETPVIELRNAVAKALMYANYGPEAAESFMNETDEKLAKSKTNPQKKTA